MHPPHSLALLPWLNLLYHPARVNSNPSPQGPPRACAQRPRPRGGPQGVRVPRGQARLGALCRSRRRDPRCRGRASADSPRDPHRGGGRGGLSAGRGEGGGGGEGGICGPVLSARTRPCVETRVSGSQGGVVSSFSPMLSPSFFLLIIPPFSPSVLGRASLPRPRRRPSRRLPGRDPPSPPRAGPARAGRAARPARGDGRGLGVV
jgi:hypothetical protein